VRRGKTATERGGELEREGEERGGERKGGERRGHLLVCM